MQRDVPAARAKGAGEEAAGPRGEGVGAAAASSSSWCSSSKAAAAAAVAAAKARRRRVRERRRQPPVGKGVPLVPLAAVPAAALFFAFLSDKVEDAAHHVADGELCFFPRCRVFGGGGGG